MSQKPETTDSKQENSKQEQHRVNRFSAAWAWFQEQDLVAVFTGLVALFTLFLAIVAAMQTCVLRNQVSQMKNDGRPWVGLGAIRSVIDNNQVTGYRFDIQNSGKSPALKTDIFIEGGGGECSKYKIPRQRCEPEKCAMHAVEMLPNSTKGFLLPPMKEGDASNPPLDGPAFNACLIARIDYEDSDGISHKTGICMQYGRYISRTCSDPTSNYAD